MNERWFWHKLVMQDEPNSRSPSPVEWEQSQNAQNVNEFYRCEEEVNIRRAECEEAGYESDSVSEANAGNGSVSSKRRRSTDSDGKPGSLFGFVKRPRERSPVPFTLLGSTVLAGILSSFRNGQKRLVRESVQFYNSYNTLEEIERLSTSLQRKNTFFAISRHMEPYEHYHVIHACPWKWYTCRCYQPTGGKRSLRTTELRTITSDDWIRELEYLCSEGRELQYLHSGSTMSKSFRGIKLLFDEGLRSSSSTDTLEVSQKPVQDCSDIGGMGSRATVGEFMVGSTSQLPKSTSRPKPEEIESFILDHLCVPVSSITMTTIWQASRFRFLTDRNPVLSQVLNSIKSRMNHWSFFDFIKFYENHTPLFAALNGCQGDYYYSIDDSCAYIDQLLEFQFYDFAMAENMLIKDYVKLFLQDVFDICERKRSKVNALELIGPASCGKSWFVDMVVNFYINVGHIKNFSRFESFPLQSAYNKRINVWNEANAEHNAWDTVKLFLGGDPCPTNIKYEDIKTIDRTPVFITANRQLIPNTAPFNDRMIRYTWKPAIFLRDLDKKPDPLCIIDLYKRYDIIKE